MCLKDADRMLNSVDPGKTAPEGVGLHLWPRPVCPNTLEKNSISLYAFVLILCMFTTTIHIQ